MLSRLLQLQRRLGRLRATVELIAALLRADQLQRTAIARVIVLRRRGSRRRNRYDA